MESLFYPSCFITLITLKSEHPATVRGRLFFLTFALFLSRLLAAAKGLGKQKR